jgi:hypothetical protein
MSNTDWWGDWRPNLPAHSGNLQPTDLIECTSIVGGLPVNTAITGQQIINAASSSGASWGGITGTLSNQTDLQSALNGKQATLVSGTSIKTVNSTSLLGSGDVAVQPTLVSGTNIKTVNGNSLLGSGDVTINGNPKTLTSMVGSNLTGTANQISASYRIAGGTIATNNSIYIRNLLTKTAGSTASTARMYINTSNSLTGATLLATAGSMTTTTYIQRFERNFYFDGTNLYVYNPSNAISTDLTSGTLTSVAFNPAIDYFLIFAVQNSSTTPDNLGHKRVIIQLYD